VDYKITYDYHTHTAYSHGKGTIEENVQAAIKKGLKGIAISDHGPGHMLYGADMKKTPEMRLEIERLRGVYEDIDIFLSVEDNIVKTGKCLDISKKEMSEYDFIIAGYHYGVRNSYCVSNFIFANSHMVGWAGRLNNKNTDMVIRAIYENPIKILTHPGAKAPFDIAEIAKACAETGTLLEINENHGHLTPADLTLAAKTDVKFIISSDAHKPKDVGSCENSIKMALKAGLDMARIVNVTAI